MCTRYIVCCFIICQKYIHTKMTYVYTNAQCLCRISCVCFCVFFLSLVAVHSYVPIHQQPLISYRISFCPKVCKCGQIVDKFPVDLFCLVFFCFLYFVRFFYLDFFDCDYYFQVLSINIRQR